MAVRYYNPDKNPDETYFPGIPLRDLEHEDWEALNEKQQAAVDASPFYRKTPLPKPVQTEET